MFLASAQVTLHGILRAAGDGGYLVDALVFHIEEGEADALHLLELPKGTVEVHLLSHIALLDGQLRLAVGGGEVFGLLAAAKIVIKNIICNTVEPSGETGEVAERGQTGVGLE